MEKLTRAMSIKMMSFMETDRGGPGGAEAFVDRLTLWWNLFVCGWSYICTHYFLERMLHALGTSNCFLYYLIWVIDSTWPDSGMPGWKKLKAVQCHPRLCRMMAGYGSVRQHMRRIDQCSRQQETWHEHKPKLLPNQKWFNSRSLPWRKCCLTDSTYAYAAVWVGGLEVWEFVALFLLIHSCLRHPSAVCLLWTLPLGWRKVWRSSGLTSWGSHVAEEQWLKVMENNDL